MAGWSKNMVSGALYEIRVNEILSQREAECLLAVADGQRLNVTAKHLGISAKTVEVHLRNTRKKLGAATTTHALAIAISRGIAQPAESDFAAAA